MANGYMGKILNVNLSANRLEDEALDMGLARDFIGGYGLGARLLYDRIPAGADPLGPDNILGILTGPLTGTPAVIGSRFVVVGKSPKTGGWGDANAGGFFGPHLKMAGYDGILVKGLSSKPVYLFIDEGRAELHDAADLWGLSVTPLEDLLKERHGKDVEVCSIGPAGERLALTSAIMTDKERACGRSGLGAVMGAKKLKAIVVKGRLNIPVFDEKMIKDLRKTILKQPAGMWEVFNKYGTAGITHDCALSGDAPVKNWSGSGLEDFPSPKARKISDDAVVGLAEYKPYGCWRCPIACGGKVTQKEGPFPLATNDGRGHKPEYETLTMFGTNLLNDDLGSIVRLNEICNNEGLDTISVGATIAYAFELYENGLIGPEDTDELELTWGNAEAIVALTEKIARREGLGDLLADGVRAAWEKLGQKGTEYAIHVDGEELPAHDPKFIPGLATTYLLAPTPGRHTQGGEMICPPGLESIVPQEKYEYSGKSDMQLKLVAAMEVVNAAGLCMFGHISYPVSYLPEQIAAVTGQPCDMEKVFQDGLRILTMRHAFNLREGINPLQRNVPGRMIGEPPLTKGNVRDITVDYKTMSQELLKSIGWKTETSVPGEKSLCDLGLDFLIEDMAAADDRLGHK